MIHFPQKKKKKKVMIHNTRVCKLGSIWIAFLGSVLAFVFSFFFFLFLIENSVFTWDVICQWVPCSVHGTHKPLFYTSFY